jgi:hypothetical protein
VYGRQAADGVVKSAAGKVTLSEEASGAVGFKGGGDSGEAPLLAQLDPRYVWRWIHKPPLIDTNLTQGGLGKGQLWHARALTIPRRLHKRPHSTQRVPCDSVD